MLRVAVHFQVPDAQQLGLAERQAAAGGSPSPPKPAAGAKSPLQQLAGAAKPAADAPAGVVVVATRVNATKGASARDWDHAM